MFTGLEREIVLLRQQYQELLQAETDLRGSILPLEVEQRRLQVEQEQVMGEWRAQQQQLALLEKQFQQAQLEHMRMKRP